MDNFTSNAVLCTLRHLAEYRYFMFRCTDAVAEVAEAEELDADGDW